MGSSRDTEDFPLVYLRRRKGTGSTSRQIVSDLNENISLNPESNPPSPKTDGSPEKRGNTGFRKGVPDLNETIFLHPELNSSTPKNDGSGETGDAGTAPSKEWRCPNCCIDDELSMPIKYLKNLDSKRKISSKKVKDRSSYSQKSKKH